MSADGPSWEPLRSSIDAVLSRARAEWCRPVDDGEVVILTATLDDAIVRVRAPLNIVEVRARELIEAGWAVEFRDLSEHPIPWSAAEGLVRPLAPEAADAEADPLVAEDDLPTLPDVAVDRLRDTA